MDEAQKGKTFLDPILEDAASPKLNELCDMFHEQRIIFLASVKHEVPISIINAYELALQFVEGIVTELIRLEKANVLPTRELKIVENFFKNRMQDMRSILDRLIYIGLKRNSDHEHIK